MIKIEIENSYGINIWRCGLGNMLMKIEGGFVEALEVLVKFQLLMKITISTD